MTRSLRVAETMSDESLIALSRVHDLWLSTASEPRALLLFVESAAKQMPQLVVLVLFAALAQRSR